MRAEAPLYWDDFTGIWGAASHALVAKFSREYQTFCSGQGSRPESSVPSMINTDPPDRTRRRRLVDAGFTPRRVADHEPYLRRKVIELIDAVIDRGECDVVADLASPLPMYMIGELMGLPESDHETLVHWSDLFATGGDDLVSLIVNADFEEPLSDVDIMFETMLVLVGGDETTRHVISGGSEALLHHPEQLAMLAPIRRSSRLRSRRCCGGPHRCAT